MTDEEKNLAISARQFLESPVCHSVLDAVTRHYRKQSDESQHDDVALREECHRMVKATRELLRQLTHLATKGKMEAMRQARGGDRSAL